MPKDVDYKESGQQPGPSEIVSFIVVCQPRSGIGDPAVLRETVTVKNVSQHLPDAGTIVVVANRIRALGFEVDVQDKSPDVPARGDVSLFEAVFKTQLEKRVRTVTTSESTSYTQEWFAVKPGAPAPSVEDIPGAMFVALPPPPLYSVPRVPPAAGAFHLRVPGDIAQLTSASAAHREGATGRGVKVALIDTGFFPHSYYVNHRYKFAPTAVGPTDPTADPIDHGTSTLANLFACAPDVEAYAIKPAGLVELAIDYARTLPIRVLSLSWGHDCIGIRTFPIADLFPLWLRIILTVADGISVVAAAGNGEMNFPAMMPEVMAVGGVAVAVNDAHTVWPNTSSFVSPIYPRRYVPDFCGLASEIMVPIAGPASWAVKPGTSWATPQVAGVCALMIQKDPTLTPDVIRNRLIETAIDITSGNSINLPGMPSQPAARGNDRATGAGLVNAFEAWRRV